MLGCRVGEFPTTYLGHSLGAPHKLTKAWDGGREISEKAYYAEEEIPLTRRKVHIN